MSIMLDCYWTATTQTRIARWVCLLRFSLRCPIHRNLSCTKGSVATPITTWWFVVEEKLFLQPFSLLGVEAFCWRLESVIKLPTTPLPTCQPASKDKDCSIRIRRPCLYIFPEGSGQSAIFALPGFTFMVNAGSSQDPKCWKIAQYFETWVPTP